MNQSLKNNLLKVYNYMNNSETGNKLINYFFFYKNQSLKVKDNKQAMVSTLKNFNNFYIPTVKVNKGLQIYKLFEKVDINIADEGFIYTLDEFKTINNLNFIPANISVDYLKILNHSLKDFKDVYNTNDIINQEYLTVQKDLISAIEILIDREVNALKNSKRPDKDKYIGYLNNIKDKKAQSFEEGLQRILFFNQLLWQTGHSLIGLGRLDKVLNDLYCADIENSVITKDEALDLIKSFYLSLHEYYWFKSCAMMGDTGQVIVLGGLEEDGGYFVNDLTYMFIEALKDLNIPDPKCLLRVSTNTPQDLMDLSLNTMKTGVGSPLLSNDELIIKDLIDFGYDKKDAYNHVVSACWEPEPIGKSFGQNNIKIINFLIPLNNLFDRENLSSIGNFDDLLNIYLKKYLPDYINELICELNSMEWERDPILSFFIDDCNHKQLDISEGGAKYNNFGVTSVGLSNTVNSLYNIKKFVFEEGMDINKLNECRKSNFNEDDKTLNLLKSQKIRYGIDNNDIIKLANEITNTVDSIFKNNTTKLGGKFKFGLSSPNYIMDAPKVKASFDGRRDFEPFNVHISNENSEDYLELIRFASKLDYNGGRFNGNVADLMVNPLFIENHFNKFLDFIILSIKQGFFQLQMNVISSDILIKAKENPGEFPNLIVRVWGFSSYFKDLPGEYQDVLIQRALKNEGKA